MSTHNIPFFIINNNIPKLSQIWNYGICSKGLKNEFETAMVNEPSVFEPLKFYCSYIHCSKGNNSTPWKPKVMVHVCCMSTHGALHLCEVPENI